jgi:hypothetical protein
MHFRQFVYILLLLPITGLAQSDTVGRSGSFDNITILLPSTCKRPAPVFLKVENRQPRSTDGNHYDLISSNPVLAFDGALSY